MGQRAQPVSDVICVIGDRPLSKRRNIFFVLRVGGRNGRRQVSTALMTWVTHTLQWRKTMGRKLVMVSKPLKFRLSSDWGLQPDPMKSESVVIADQQAAVNTFSGLVHTARQANKVGGA